MPRSTPLLRLGVKRPRWDGAGPWGLVWTCSDLCDAPEVLLGAEAGELVTLQACSTMPHADALADVTWAVQEHALTHVIVLGHADCRLLRSALTNPGPMPTLSAQLVRLGLLAGTDPDDASRTLAQRARQHVRAQLARHAIAAHVACGYADARGQVTALHETTHAAGTHARIGSA